MTRRVVRVGPYRRTHGVVQYSSGVGSWAAAMRARERHAPGNFHLLFADTLIEDDDNYRFLIESAAQVFEVPTPTSLVARALELPPVDQSKDRKVALLQLAQEAMEAIPGLHWVAEGRDPWELFRDRKFIGNHRVDLCSETLKRNFLRTWMTENFSPIDTVAYIGIDWTEEHRFETARARWSPWWIEAPLCEAPLHAKARFQEELAALGIAHPRLYDEGFPHANCGGFCIKAGMAHFKLLAQQRPEVYAYHERREQEMREHLGKDVAILRDRTQAAKDTNGGKAKPLPLQDLRQRLIEGGEIDEFDWGGCGCAI